MPSFTSAEEWPGLKLFSGRKGGSGGGGGGGGGGGVCVCVWGGGDGGGWRFSEIEIMTEEEFASLLYHFRSF